VGSNPHFFGTPNYLLENKMQFDQLTKHIKQLNELEQIKHHQRATAAIERIKELRRIARSQQETTACADTSGRVR
jgi:hypothetical protein